LAKTAVIYITVLFAAMSILYAFYYPIVQKLYWDFVNYSASQLRTQLIRQAHGTVTGTLSSPLSASTSP